MNPDAKERSGKTRVAAGGGGTSRASMVFLGTLLALAGVIFGFLAVLSEQEEPGISPNTATGFIGVKRDIGFTFTDAKSGLRLVEMHLLQGGKDVKLLAEKFPRKGLFHAGPDRVEKTVTVEGGSLGLQEGKAELVVSARDYSLWNFFSGNLTELRYPVLIDTKKPEIAVQGATRYVKPGGSALVVYKVNEPAETHGAVVGGVFHPGFPLPAKGENVYGAFMGLPYDLQDLKDLHVTVTDRAGNVGRTNFGMILQKARYKNDQIEISDTFLNNKMPEFLDHYKNIPGKDPVEQYVYVNSKIRVENNDRIRQVTSHSAPEKLWEGVFGRNPRSSPRAGYADTRDYLYKGKAIDRQTHLGVDLASTERAEVEASNRGRVVLAEYLGIYGNTVILDHGLGIFSLYSHLSEIRVNAGDLLEKRGVLGISGTTGMAGGDHLHFSMLVNGVFVTPIEWWDDHWIKVSVQEFL